MFGKVKSYRWTDDEFEAMVVGGRATFLLDDHGAFIKDDHRFPKRWQLQEGATLRDEARASCRLRVAPRRTPHRLDFGLAELVRLVVFRRSDGKPSNSAATCAWGRVTQHPLPSRAQIEEGIDQYYPTNGYAFGVNKPRRTQITQRPNSSSARGIVPACPARCLRWSPNVQMPAPSGTRIGAVSSAVRGVEVLFLPLLTASLHRRRCRV